MKRLHPYTASFGLLAMLLCTTSAGAQSFYFSGAFVDKQNNPVAYVNIKPANSPISFQAGNTGEFGITSFHKTDSATCYLEGYDTLRILLQHGVFGKFVLHMQPSFAEKLIKASRLSSLAKVSAQLLTDQPTAYSHPGESYHKLVENQWFSPAHAPFTGFVPNINRSSYANIRRFIRQHQQVPPNAVRIEELWNYFGYTLAPPPQPGQLFSLYATLTQCPWNMANQLVIFNARAQRVNMDSLPPLNLIFLIDNSGSMDEPNRLPLLKMGFKKMVQHLRPQDRVGIVTYGGAAGIYLPPTYGDKQEEMMLAIDSLVAGGATAGANGIQLAYELVTTHSFAQGINKVILATDGDFNVGASNEAELEMLIGRYRSTGVTLSCLGVGMGNYKDSKIEVLARLGNGHFAYLDSEEEAEKIMVNQLGESLYTMAKDVTIQLGFYENTVKAYRLIGYENKAEALKVMPLTLIGNDVGSGQSIMAMAEIIPPDDTKPTLDPIGFLKLQYKWPKKDSTEQINLEIPNQLTQLPVADSSIKIAIALAWMGTALKKPLDSPDFASIGRWITDALHPQNPDKAGLLQLLEGLEKVYRKPGTQYKSKKKKAAQN